MKNSPRAATCIQPLGELLLEQGAISRAELEQAMQSKRQSRLKLGQALVQLGSLDQATLEAALIQQGRMPCIEIVPGLVDVSVARELSSSTASTFRCIALHRTAGITTIAMEDPDDIAAIEAIRAELGTPVFAVHADPTGVAECSELVRRAEASRGVPLESLLDHAIAAVELDPALEESAPCFEEEGIEGPILNLIQSLVGEAHGTQVDQIHFDPDPGQLVVRLRRGEDSVERLTLERSWARPLIARIKLMASLDLRERHRVQEGRACMRIGDQRIELRFVTGPTEHGEAATIDLHAAEPEHRLDDLGLDPADEVRLRGLCLERGGLMLVVGRSRAERTATLQAMLRELAQPGRKLAAIEPPHFHTREEVLRIRAGDGEDRDLTEAFREALDKGAEIVLVDELDSPEALQLAACAALDGTTVLAGMFAEDATRALERLDELGLEGFVIAGALRGVLRQRLLPRLCELCKEPESIDADFAHALGLDHETSRFCQPGGCAVCHETGMAGRVPLFELTTLDDELRARLRVGLRGAELRTALEQCVGSLRERALQLAARGHTPVREILQLVRRASA